ncbi:hypothetical protein JCM10296v2_006701 [Rhodotorula toruloides]
MPRRAYSYYGFKQAVSNVLAGYGVQGQGLSRDAAGRQFKIGVFKVVDEDTWLGDAEYDRHGSSRSSEDLGERYGLMLLGEVPATNEEATVVAPPQVAMSSSASAPPPYRPSTTSTRPPSHAQPREHLPPTHPLPPTAIEAFEEAHIPALDLKKKPSDLLYIFGANHFLQTVYAGDFLKGLKTVLPDHNWAQLMEAPGCGDCQAPFEHVQQDAVKLEQVWETTPAAHISGRMAFKAVCEALLGRIVTTGVLKEFAEQRDAKVVGEAYAVMLASLAVDDMIASPLPLALVVVG